MGPGQRGFSLVETLVALTIFSGFVIVAAATFGSRGSHVHSAALALEEALAEARSLAMATADTTDLAYPTGATVTVASDPSVSGGSVISVYRSRPIANANPGAAAFALPLDAGFPVQHVPATFTVTAASAGAAPVRAPFAILLAASGYASIVAGYVYDANNPVILSGPDPGCDDAGETISAADGTRSETHPFACRDGSYDVSVAR
jgi:prepilin-type N-terminal cleavage/methylation domain-containing protein